MSWRAYVIVAEVLVGIAIIAAAIYLLTDAKTTLNEEPPASVPSSTPLPVATTTPQPDIVTIGTSVENRAIETYRFGTGAEELLLVGGIHGGYEWNSVLLAYEMIDYLTNTPSAIPDNLTVTIIPVLNPDGLAVVTGTAGRFAVTDVTNWSSDGRGRFNARNVDLNRNFDCNWSESSTWRGVPVETGSGPFSEPEAAALRAYVVNNQPVAAVFWHSVANAVYASECNNGVLPTTLDLMNAYATAGSYKVVPVFDAYPITGDVEGWLASVGIPAITVELETRDSTEWSRNVAGTLAVINYFAE